MRITIQVVCEDAEDAKKVITKLTAPDNTWVAQIEQGGSAPKAAEKSRSSADSLSTAAGATDAPRPNVSPGEPAIGKIGSATAEFLLAEIRAKDRTPTDLGAKYVEHLKLLWKRNLVKYDGKEYYLD